MVDTMILKTKKYPVSPRKLKYRGQMYDILWCDSRFKIKEWAVKVTRKDRIILGARLYNCYHPNATDMDENKQELNVMGKTPKELDFCLSHVLKGETFNKKVKPWDLVICFEIWNLDASYYIPSHKLVRCKPVWKPSREHLKEMTRQRNLARRGVF